VWPYLVGLCAVAVGRSMVVVAQPTLMRQIVDTIKSVPQAQLYAAMLPLIGWYVAIGFIFVLLFRSYDILNYCFAPKQKAIIMDRLTAHLMQHPTAFYQRHSAGNLTSKVNDVTLYVPEIVKIVTDHFVTAALTLVFVLISVSQVQARFAWALSAWLVIFMLGALGMLFSASHYVRGAAEARGRLVGHLVDVLMNMVSVRLFGRRGHEQRLMNDVTAKALTQERACERFFMKLHLFQGTSFWIFEGICFWWLFQGVLDGSITPGQLILVFSLNLQILDQFWGLGNQVRSFWEKRGYIAQALELITSPIQMHEADDMPSLKIERGAVTFQNVHFFYEGSPPLFQNKTIHIPGGQRVGLVGYSGSGKSTFISLILRLYDVTDGAVLIDGQDVRKVSRQSLYDAIAVVPQETFLFNRSLMDNIRYGRLEATDEQVFDCTSRAEMHSVITGLPLGYQTSAGERGSRLSGGQRQRITIARALLKNAPIILMDEATSSLDSVTEDKLQSAFESLMDGKTALVIAHRLSTLQKMDRILVFDQGKILQDGPHSHLIAQEGLYRQLWAKQSDGFLITDPVSPA
jgi:ATP-binding cassette, subfamily B, bacterial